MELKQKTQNTLTHTHNKQWYISLQKRSNTSQLCNCTVIGRGCFFQSLVASRPKQVAAIKSSKQSQQWPEYHLRAQLVEPILDIPKSWHRRGHLHLLRESRHAFGHGSQPWVPGNGARQWCPAMLRHCLHTSPSWEIIFMIRRQAGCLSVALAFSNTTLAIPSKSDSMCGWMAWGSDAWDRIPSRHPFIVSHKIGGPQMG